MLLKDLFFDKCCLKISLVTVWLEIGISILSLNLVFPISLSGSRQDSPRWTSQCHRTDKFKISLWTPPESWFSHAWSIVHINTIGRSKKEMWMLVFTSTLSSPILQSFVKWHPLKCRSCLQSLMWWRKTLHLLPWSSLNSKLVDHRSLSIPLLDFHSVPLFYIKYFSKHRCSNSSWIYLLSIGRWEVVVLWEIPLFIKR